MRKIYSLLVLSFLFFATSNAQNLKPYVEAGVSNAANMQEILTEVKAKLTDNGFKVLGDYKAVQSNKRRVIAISHPELIKAVKKNGGFTGFALALRVAITKEKGGFLVSYTNPHYWGAAYFTNNYKNVKSHYNSVDQAFKTAFAGYGSAKEFGSKKGLTANKLVKYKYMMGMPKFEDNVLLGEFANYTEAVNTIDNNLNSTTDDLIKVYEMALPGKKIKLYGIGLKGENGEGKFMPIIDNSNPKHTAFLPYELLVYNNKAYMLHGRFRIALSFPDLSMGTFMKIVSTPGNIEELLKSACQ